MIAEQVLSSSIKGLASWDKGVSLDEILDNLSADDKGKEYRSMVSSILFTYFRNKAHIDYVIDSLVNRKIESVVKRIISVALVQVFYQDGIPKEVAVDVAVNHARKIRNKKTGGFVNAILRNAMRGAFDINEKIIPETIKSNLPHSLLEKWKKTFSEQAFHKIIDVIKQQPPFTFRLLKKVDTSILDECNCEPVKDLPWSNKFSFYKTDRPDLIFKTDLIESGSIYIQDPATSMAPCLFDGQNPKKILDICAAPGGKSLMLSELYPNTKITAMDRSTKRLKRVSENIERTGTRNITITQGDTLNPPFEKNSFDIVFADVPCSNTGVIRHRPDVTWRFSLKHQKEIIKLQSNIINSASRLVKPGGLFVYSTCSIEKEENRNQIDQLLANNKDFDFVEDKLILPSGINDGAYAAVLMG